jgi:hypothetical protein
VSTSGADLAAAARAWLGTPYRWAGNDRSGIDCSGLIQQIYAGFGIDLPRVTYDQINVGASVNPDKLQPGDLVFFDTDAKKAGPDHVGIYIGGGKFIHAPKTGDVVKISSLTDSYYMNRWMGGRRIAGVSPSTLFGQEASAAEPTVKLDATELAEKYGMSYAFFKSQPELMKLLKGAVGEQWDTKLFQAHLKNTKWWKENSSSVRKAQILAKTDPATYKANLAAAQAAAQQAAVQTGAILSGKQLQRLAKNMVDLNWNDAQVASFLGQYVTFNKDHVLGGQAAAAAKQITQMAYENGIQVSDQTIKNNAAYLIGGLTSMEKIQASLRQQAAGTYPGFADQIAAGANMSDIAQPYIQMVSQELGLPETAVNIFHPKVRAAIQRADGKGQPSPMDLTDFQRLIRDDPAWGRTPTAINNTMTIGRQVLANLGLGT